MVEIEPVDEMNVATAHARRFLCSSRTIRDAPPKRWRRNTSPEKATAGWVGASFTSDGTANSGMGAFRVSTGISFSRGYSDATLFTATGSFFCGAK